MKNSILTQRLLLETFSEKHISEAYISWLNNKELMRYSEQRHKKHSYETCLRYLQSFEGTPHYFWAITVKDSGLHIGNINAYLDTNNRLADLGIIIGDSCAQGQGYALEAWKAVMDFLFQEKHIRKITAGTLANNIGMLKVMTKAGMQPDGTRQQHYLVEGEAVDLIHMASFLP